MKAVIRRQKLSIHHEAREGHEEWTIGLKKEQTSRPSFSPFVLFETFVMIYAG